MHHVYARMQLIEATWPAGEAAYCITRGVCPLRTRGMPGMSVLRACHIVTGNNGLLAKLGAYVNALMLSCCQ